MAVYNDQTNPLISSIGDSIYNAEFDENGDPKFDSDGKTIVGTVSWDQKSGKNVEDYITRRLNNIDDNVDNMYSLISGIVGTGVAVEFRTWTKIYQNLPDIEDIFSGKNPPLPSNTDALYALTSSMVSYARSHKDDM